MRNFTFEGDGGTNTDLIQGTPLRDINTGKWWWAPNFCGVCTPEQRDNVDLLVKGSYITNSFDPIRTYDVSADGQRFLLIKPDTSPQSNPASAGLIVVLNWVEELERLAPLK